MSSRTYPTRRCFAALLLLIACVGCGESEPAPDSSIQWIDPNDLQQGPTRHDALPEELLVRIKAVHETFADVDGTPLEKWIDDFKRDLDPEGNVKIWEDMQVAFNAYCGDRQLPLAARKEVFKIVLMRSMMPDDDVRARIVLEHIPADDLNTILAAYPGEAKPIDIIQANP